VKLQQNKPALSLQKVYGWIHRDASLLMEINPYYPIATLPHTVHFPLDQINHVLDGLQGSFHALSLHVLYQEGDGETQSLAAFCENMDGVLFRVQLWKMDATSGIIDVQRTAGEQIIFFPLVQRIVRDVEDTVTPPTLSSSPTGAFEILTDRLCYDKAAFAKFQEHLDAVMQDVDKSSWPTSSVNNSNSSTDPALVVEPFAEMILAVPCDRVYKGLDTLKIMMDPNESTLTSVIAAGRFVVCQGASKASECIWYLAFCGTWPESVPIDDMRRHETMQKRFSFLALTIVAQALSLAEKENVDLFVNKTSAVPGIDVVSSMMSAIKNAKEAPHRAYVACQVLACLCRDQESIRVEVSKDRQVVEDAKHIGDKTHDALSQSSERLLDALNGYGRE
jgi:hypothetical protein